MKMGKLQDGSILFFTARMKRQACILQAAAATAQGELSHCTLKQDLWRSTWKNRPISSTLPS